MGAGMEKVHMLDSTYDTSTENGVILNEKPELIFFVNLFFFTFIRSDVVGLGILFESETRLIPSHSLQLISKISMSTIHTQHAGKILQD